MPDYHYSHMDDSASYASSTVSFSTAHTESPAPPVQIRPRNSVKRWVSKRMSQRRSLGMSLASGWDNRPVSSWSNQRPVTSYNELSAKNLADLAMAIEMRDATLIDGKHSPVEPMCEIVEESIPDLDPETVTSRRISKSYADFCYDFTLSGSCKEKRTFDLNMAQLKEEDVVAVDTLSHPSDSSAATADMADAVEHLNEDHSRSFSENKFEQSASPASPTSLHSFQCPNPYTQPHTHDDGQRDQISSFPLPPPDIITPTMYQEQLAQKGRKKQSFWKPLRSIFAKSLHFWGPRYEVNNTAY